MKDPDQTSKNMTKQILTVYVRKSRVYTNFMQIREFGGYTMVTEGNMWLVSEGNIESGIFRQ